MYYVLVDFNCPFHKKDIIEQGRAKEKCIIYKKKIKKKYKERLLLLRVSKIRDLQKSNRS